MELLLRPAGEQVSWGAEGEVGRGGSGRGTLNASIMVVDLMALDQGK